MTNDEKQAYWSGFLAGVLAGFVLFGIAACQTFELGRTLGWW